MTAEFMSGLIGPIEPNRNQLLIQQRDPGKSIRRDPKESFKKIAFEAAASSRRRSLPSNSRTGRASSSKKSLKKTIRERVAQSLRRRGRRASGSRDGSSGSEIKFPLGGIVGMYDISRLIFGRG
jgi:hypothetical protein